MILIVIEDNPEHQKDAEKALTDTGFRLENFELSTFWKLKFCAMEEKIAMVVQNFHGFHEIMNEVFGFSSEKLNFELLVISDVNFPLGPDFPVQPVGLLVGEFCAKHDIPFVFCTDGAHHGKENALLENFRIVAGWKRRIIDRTIDGHKRWQDAIKEVLE